MHAYPDMLLKRLQRCVCMRIGAELFMLHAIGAFNDPVICMHDG